MDNKQETISQIREFNRFYTVLLGFLNQDYLSSGYSVTETRMLFEIYRNQPISASTLIAMLHLDKSYISRLIRAFERKNLVTRQLSSSNARLRVIELTSHGREEVDRLISITNQSIEDLIEPLSRKQCHAVCNAMRTIIDSFDKEQSEEATQ